MTSPDPWLERLPLVAILRGVGPDEVVGIGRALVEAGFAIIEVPLNSPEPFESIRLMSQALAGRAIGGAGTVLREQDVERVAQAGGTLVVSPNMNPATPPSFKWAPDHTSQASDDSQASTRSKAAPTTTTPTSTIPSTNSTSRGPRPRRALRTSA